MQNEITNIFSGLSHGLISTDPDDCAQYGVDWTRLHPARPCGVAFPKNTSDVAKIMRACNEAGVAVVPSGGRTGLAGGAVATNGELVLSLSKMDKIQKIDLLSMTLQVEAGVITQSVHHFCEPFGVTWPVDFGSKGSSTVGGNIATNAGGINVIKYGMTRNWVLGLTVVTMTGEILKLNGALEKNNTGLDLKHLFIGSEGILGVVTEATLKLTRVEKLANLYFFGVSDMNRVFSLLEKTRTSPFEICAYEVFSSNCFEACTKALSVASPFQEKHSQYVLIEVKSSGGQDEFDVWLESVFSDELVQEGVQAKSTEDIKNFWKVRESIAEVIKDFGLNHSNDISVPIFNLKKFIEEWSALFAQKYSTWNQFVFGHVGDGNLHIHTVKPSAMSLEKFHEEVGRIDGELFNLVRKFEGSISAEHGVGLLKKPYLKYSKTEAELQILRSLKKSLDPKWLLNPGKIIDP